MSATNAFTITNLSSLYIKGPPTAGSNHTIDPANGAYAIRAFSRARIRTPVTANQTGCILTDSAALNVSGIIIMEWFTTIYANNVNINDPLTGRVRVLSSGFYIISANIATRKGVNSPANILTVSIRVNNTIIVESTQNNNNSANLFSQFYVHVNCITFLNANDFVDVRSNVNGTVEEVRSYRNGFVIMKLL